MKEKILFFLLFIFLVSWDGICFARQNHKHQVQVQSQEQDRHTSKHRRHHKKVRHKESKQVRHGMHGLATWYGRDWHGRPTSSGEMFDCQALTAAHPSLPLGCRVNVTNLRNGQSVIVRINDRGPYSRGLVIDVSERVAEMLGFKHSGKTPVSLSIVP